MCILHGPSTYLPRRVKSNRHVLVHTCTESAFLLVVTLSHRITYIYVHITSLWSEREMVVRKRAQCGRKIVCITFGDNGR